MAWTDCLAAHGWATERATSDTTDGIIAEMLELASVLGDIAPGRGRQLVEKLSPLSSGAARPGSLSSMYGLQPLPLHIDTAHWCTPARYLLLACIDPGLVLTPTLLLDCTRAELAEHEVTASRSAVFAIRNGRSSFYGSILDSGRPFIRLDPGCMTPMSADGVVAMSAFTSKRQSKSIVRHHWQRGDILMLDNWRTLHGRGDNSSAAPSRTLVRTMVR